MRKRLFEQGENTDKLVVGATHLWQKKEAFFQTFIRSGKKPLYFCLYAHKVGKTNLSVFLPCEFSLKHAH